MRLIDADALDWERIEHEHGARHEAVVDCEQMVEKAPTIDAVPATLTDTLCYLHEVGWMQEHDKFLTKDVAPVRHGRWKKTITYLSTRCTGVRCAVRSFILKMAHHRRTNTTTDQTAVQRWAAMQMIKLTVDGACKDCPLRSIKVLDAIGEPIARCEHQTVCKYIEKEWHKDTTHDKKTP